MKVEPFEPLDAALYREIVRRALAEDLRWGDVTTEATVSPDQRARGELHTRQDCVLAGLDVSLEAFRQLDPQSTVVEQRHDGDSCHAGDRVLVLAGFAAALLTAERTALNFLQRLSGIATVAQRYVAAADGRTTILDTRKTTPTLRMLEKYAVRAGGGVNHRLGLDDGLLIKDNHVRLAGSVSAAVELVQEQRPEHDLPIEVEAHTLEDVDEALQAEVDIVLLDNFDLDDLATALDRCRGRVKTEVSGRVSLERVDAIAALEPTYISVGALTHSAPSIDMSFTVAPA